MIEHALLGLSVAALAGAGLRVAALTGATGLPRVLAAATLAVAAAVLGALALGLVGLGGSPIALSAAAFATWLAARRTKGTVPFVRDELVDWWAGLRGAERALAGAVAVTTVVWAAWQVRNPLLGLDSLIYHLSLPGAWVQEGSPGAIAEVVPGLPVANYPVTSEVALSWAIGISRSWVVASVVNVALAALLGAACVAGLRALRVPRGVAALATAAVLALPLLVLQLGGPATDLAAVTWLIVAAALAASAVRGAPALIGVALLAAGLALGTKTTTALPLLAALVPAAWALRAHRAPLAAGAIGAVLVGGLWPLRNLLDHGSPLWPFASGPFGDPVPAVIAAVQRSFIEHPGEMLDGRAGAYAEVLAGGLVLLAGAVLAARYRRARYATAVLLVAILAWTAAPFTGIDSDEYAIGALRYLLPALAVAALAVSLAGTRVAAAVLAVAFGWSLLRSLDAGFPVIPGAATLLGSLALGAVLGLAVKRLPRHPALAPALAVVAGAALALGAPGYVTRHAEVAQLDDGLFAGLHALPGYEGSERPVAMAPAVLPLVAGDRLEHEVVLLRPGSGCDTARSYADGGFLALKVAPPRPEVARLQACLGDREPAWVNPTWAVYGAPRS